MVEQYSKYIDLSGVIKDYYYGDISYDNLLTKININENILGTQIIYYEVENAANIKSNPIKKEKHSLLKRKI